MSIQRHYRGHKERREMNGMCLTPDQRWTEAVADARWRTTADVPSHGSETEQKPGKFNTTTRTTIRRVAMNGKKSMTGRELSSGGRKNKI
ncbi:hypothetical protein BZA05DRAFT_191163 [Tricharina praecox]|uniref:uncharacterized protein n=1 Tax=Tricharina praecox TaxID=43433 RepID=UPI00221FF3EA|nr:uncharacterized protein BZA05DRAFT_191163 [Tricharina praecox]KAI5842679.1 hypothetical protein BZA05DRAFT_191163 [Tricharina praecox]